MTVTKLKIAVAQIDIAFGQPAVNFQRVETFVKKAAAQKVDIVAFPEMWNTGYALTELDQLADPDGLQTQALLSRLAKENQLYIFGGSVATKEAGKFYNTTYVYDPKGQLLTTYRKVHLFGLMHEGDHLDAGAAETHFNIGKIAATNVICYDIRFPEWLRKLSAAGSSLIFVPAEWPTVRIKQWARLLAARAIENQSFVVAINRVGSDPDNAFGGHSLVLDPLGDAILTLGDQEELGIAEIDLDQIPAIRGEIPVFEDRRPELY
ncbi:nitrilase cyanide hydratase and apolipoprotein N-acyltransferase [Agrilactobacillus composti DSM 18527 = JCM 14202]|uniref:Nitrilase cyanide hydratase and apolipoprotein N-acyltransferase n=1 Tax=Agrilactobacillus composti DSM 18527 = JCM 14202 TaxID=1423734 RepID=A0A0R1XX99_9LACO|nr:carbon-nitrogen family hydrolase [Agrilactobacillus composti]KRM34807.1 nitrilase cyanide hydratase and apolipoprotein N-acyltransferase [Agrilactobacillus composti DSM 18527 = JCM 14202]